MMSRNQRICVVSCESNFYNAREYIFPTTESLDSDLV